jgi:hypothetical protein
VSRVRYIFGHYRGATLLRAAYWVLVRHWDAEICQDCGRPVREVWWCHDDLLWEKVTGRPKPAGSREAAGGVFCIRCFDAAARTVCGWVEWAPLNLRFLQSEDEVRASVELRHPDTSEEGR